MEQTRIDFLLERALWALVSAILILGPLATGLVRPQDFVFVIWLTIAALSIWIVRLWINTNIRLLWHPASWAVLAFLSYAAWRYNTSPIEYIARQELIRVLVYGSVFFLILNNLHRQDASQFLAGLLILLATLISLYAIYQFFSKSEKVWHFTRPLGYSGRASGTYINPNHLAGFLEVILPVALAYVLCGRINPLGRVFIGYAALVILAAIGMTISRGGWLATMAGIGSLLFAMLFQKGGKLIPVLATVGMLAAAGAGLYLVAKKADEGKNRLSSSTQYTDIRHKVWPAAIAIWKEDPWFGKGLNHFDHHFKRFRALDLQLTGRPERVHNDYLNTLADWGIVGASIIAIFLGLLAWGVVKCWRFLQRSSGDQSRASNRSSLVLGASCGIIAILTHSIFDFNMHIPANALTVIALMAIIAGFVRFASDRYWSSNAWWVRMGASLPVLAVAGYLVLNVQKLQGETKAILASRNSTQFDLNYLSFLQKAFSIEPQNPKTSLDLGEYYWQKASEGAEGNEMAAREAIKWFDQCAALNPFDPYPLFRRGMCLDWLEKHDEAKPWFEKALALDPNGYNTVNHMGWHYFQIGQYAEAKKFFERSMGLYWIDNTMARTYLGLIEKKLSATPEKPALKN